MAVLITVTDKKIFLIILQILKYLDRLFLKRRGYMAVSHKSRPYICMPETLLHRPGMLTVDKQNRRMCVPKHMKIFFRYSRLPAQLSK